MVSNTCCIPERNIKQFDEFRSGAVGNFLTVKTVYFDMFPYCQIKNGLHCGPSITITYKLKVIPYEIFEWILGIEIFGHSLNSKDDNNDKNNCHLLFFYLDFKLSDFWPACHVFNQQDVVSIHFKHVMSTLQ